MPNAALALPPPLRAGERLRRDEFLERWRAMPGLGHAELINGVVHMPSPVSRPHRSFHSLITMWLGCYRLATPGLDVGTSGTWLMSEVDVPQPDVDMCILPEFGGQSRVNGDYPEGAPELIVEISHTTASKDAGEKLRLYERSGVREYVTVRPGRQQIVWRAMVRRKYGEIAPDKNGVYRSRVFPGLWLDSASLWKQDLPGLAATVQAGLATVDHARFVQALARYGR